MTSVDFWGAVNTGFILSSVYGVFSQLSTIKHRRNGLNRSAATALLSLNQFTVSFFAYFSFFVYGYSITPFNHFIVWPRLIASLVVLAILFEIFKDRKTIATKYAFGIASVALALGVFGLFAGNRLVDSSRFIATILILTISVFIAQGYAHQIRVIIKRGDTGAIDIKMSQFILLMDISTIALAFAVGVKFSWPLMVLAVTSAITKLCILYLFYWVRVSPLAKHRRAIAIHT
jgi:hypothetical protein